MTVGCRNKGKVDWINNYTHAIPIKRIYQKCYSWVTKVSREKVLKGVCECARVFEKADKERRDETEVIGDKKEGVC